MEIVNEIDQDLFIERIKSKGKTLWYAEEACRQVEMNKSKPKHYTFIANGQTTQVEIPYL